MEESVCAGIVDDEQQHQSRYGITPNSYIKAVAFYKPDKRDKAIDGIKTSL